MHNNNNNNNDRFDVLHFALKIEDSISILLCKILGVKHRDKSKSFGSTSATLSLNQRINILLDMEILKKEEVQLFTDFMVMRNQFMHNIKVETFKEFYLKDNTGIRNRINNKFGSSIFSVGEDDLNHKLFMSLVSELMNLIIKIERIAEERAREAARIEQLMKFLELTYECIDHMQKGLNEMGNQLNSDNQVHDKEHLNKLGDYVSNQLRMNIAAGIGLIK